MKCLSPTSRIFAGLCVMLCTAIVSAQSQPLLTLQIDLEDVFEGWEVDTQTVRVITDEIAQQPAFEPQAVPRKGLAAQFRTAQPITPGTVIEADVRLPVQASVVPNAYRMVNATLYLEQPSEDEKKVPSYTLSLGRPRGNSDVSWTAGSTSADGSKRSAVFTPWFDLEKISPLMEEHARIILEQRTPSLPLAHERIHHLRMEIRKDQVRTYANGRLIGEFPGPVAPGHVQLTLGGQARLINMTVRALPQIEDRFVTVPLDDQFNASGFGVPEGIAPTRGEIANVGNVPFITSQGVNGEDHLDVEPSVFLHRMGIFRVAESREAVLAPETLDVGRFTLRVPQRTYRRAWVLAASDGDDTSAPVLTIRFYRPKMPWNIDKTIEVPTFETTTAPKDAVRVPMTGEDGKDKSVWLIPIELDAAALAAEPMSHVEITKAIYPYRSWPDPAYYNAYPGGLPSAVHVYGLTFEEAPIAARGTGTQNGNLYPDGQQPVWRVLLSNLSKTKRDVKVNITVADPYGKTTTQEKKISLAADAAEQEVRFEPKAEMNGLYTVTTTVTSGDFTQSRDGTFLKIPKIARKAGPQDSPWGLWCWTGGHNTNPDPRDNARLLKALGAINNFDFAADRGKTPLYDLRKEMGLGATHHRLVPRRIPAWAYEDPIDQEKFNAYAEEKGKEAAELLKEHPDLQFVNFFAENYISLRLTHGMSPWAYGEPYFEYDEREANRIRAHWITAKAALKGLREHAPSLKVLFGHGAGNFVQPFWLLEDWDNDLFTGFGMDLPQFERMPERQPRATEPSLLYFLKKQMEDNSATGMEVVHLESYFPSSGPLALNYDEQADSVVRTAMLSMAMGTTRFMHTWTLHTSGDGWGGSHYGSAGLIDRAPEFNPKPAAAAFATMTAVIDMAKYDRYLDTGSRSAYCLQFKDTDRYVYPVWTIRGTRPMTLTFEGNAKVTRIDMHGNTFPVDVTDNKTTVTLSNTPQWIVVRGGGHVAAAEVGAPAYDAKPAENSVVLNEFNDKSWKQIDGEWTRYQNNHWDMPRKPGSFSQEFVTSEERGSSVMRVNMLEPDNNAPLAGFYTIFEPGKPIKLDGKPQALGLWVNGKSAWNRFIYEIKDATGESFVSVGTTDAWNCDDIFSWSSANFDGWRYQRFPLPGNAPGDNFREADSTWWGSDGSGDGDGIVDLPITVTRLVVEMRPQMVYVNDLLPIADHTLEFDDLTVEYANDFDMTQQPIAQQRSAANVLVKGKKLDLPNPFADLSKNGVGEGPEMVRLYPPEQGNNGTKLYIEVAPVEGAVEYRGYVSVHKDGAGAKALGVTNKSKHRDAKSITSDTVLYFQGLNATKPMYFFVTSVDADGNESKPSPIREVITKNEFPFE